MQVAKIFNAIYRTSLNVNACFYRDKHYHDTSRQLNLILMKHKANKGIIVTDQKDKTVTQILKLKFYVTR